MHTYVQLFYCQNYAQKLVDADRASLFLVDNKSNELYARIFDVGNNDNDDKVDKMIKEIRLVKSIDILFYYKNKRNYGKAINVNYYTVLSMNMHSYIQDFPCRKVSQVMLPHLEMC